ncbi:PIN domain-containing protein [Algoriphagus sp. AGSA1]|uniref:type II toxin-antitoxin system VapC family toxin n=1 Tax=Algoriphagus sp. AGSA1 TaxID=2907213 RepID=UPI001F400B5F|nr:PIN domain-containing protein [Algoriphagus sp. AGSA1]MCE7057923.1 PIN domain-containing protein [Algoriphagus sp. AGSA1]
MSRIFLDTNVILDLLGERVPFYDAIAKVVTLADQKRIKIIVSPFSFTTIDYVLSKYEASDSVLKKLRMFKILCEVCAVDEDIIEKGLNSGFKDFEDAVQYYSAVQANCSIIITRNGKDYKNSTLPVMTAEEYLSSIF